MKDLHLYLHIPFCQAKCPYCHFYSETLLSTTVPMSAYGQYLHTDLIQKKREFSLKNRQIKSIYFGGGTPTLLPIQEISKILSFIKRLWPLAKNCEITMESNPHSLDLIYLKHLSKLRINRLSLGIQTFQTKLQKILQRQVNFNKVKKILNYCKKNNISSGLDFIYGLPEQTMTDLYADLNLIQNLPCNHLSFYELELHEGTLINTWKKQKIYKFPSETTIIKMYQSICHELKTQNWEHYEISNYAKNQKYSQHNLNFWLGNDYLGVGASAVSRICGQNIENQHDLKLPAQKQPFTKAENTIQYLMGRLRLNIGLNFSDLENAFMKKIQNLAKTWPQDDFLRNDSQKLILNENGWLKYDYYLKELALLTYDYYGEN